MGLRWGSWPHGAAATPRAAAGDAAGPGAAAASHPQARGGQQALAVFSSCRNSAPWAGHFFPLLSLSPFGDFPHSAFDLPPVFVQPIGSDGVRG